MAKKEKEPVKRMVFELPVSTHCDIKKRAAERNISVKKWLCIAIDERIAKERLYE